MLLHIQERIFLICGLAPTCTFMSHLAYKNNIHETFFFAKSLSLAAMNYKPSN